jgi:hypothetical protein
MRSHLPMTKKLENPYGKNHYSAWTRSQLENALVYAVTQLDVIAETLNGALTNINEENDWENHVNRFYGNTTVFFPKTPEQHTRLLQVAWDARENANGGINWHEDPEHFSN